MFEKSRKEDCAAQSSKVKAASSGKASKLSQVKTSFSYHIPLLQKVIGNQGVLSMIQSKRKSGKSSNKYEREADQAANTLLKMPEKNEGTEKGNKNRDSTTNYSIGSASSLPKSVQSHFESHFGHDFSDVRIHVGPKAEQITGMMNARAVTVGSNVIFGKGQYLPESVEGQRLLAHELSHVVQQTQPGGSHIPSIQMLALPAKGGLAGAGLGALVGAGVGVLAGGALGAVLGGLAGLLVGGVLGLLGGKLLVYNRLRTVLLEGLSEADKEAEEQALLQITSGQLTFTAATRVHAGVRAIQRMLSTLGYPAGRQQVLNQAGQVIGVSGTFSVDGDYGPGTEAGMQLFQREWNDAHPGADIPLRVDGACDSSTLAALMATTTERVSGMSFREFGAQKEILARTAGMNTEEVHDNYGEYIRDKASEYRIPEDVIAAIIMVETRGWIRHRLEYHVYQRFLNVLNNGGQYHGITQNQLQNMSLSEIRILSTSWGLGQVMGFNLYNAGVSFEEIQNVSDYEQQVDMIGRFLQANILLNAARTRNWNAIAAGYNGPAAVGIYAPRLQAASNAWLNFIAQNP